MSSRLPVRGAAQSVLSHRLQRVGPGGMHQVAEDGGAADRSRYTTASSPSRRSGAAGDAAPRRAAMQPIGERRDPTGWSSHGSSHYNDSGLDRQGVSEGRSKDPRRERTCMQFHKVLSRQRSHHHRRLAECPLVKIAEVVGCTYEFGSTWHFCDIGIGRANVRSEGKSGLNIRPTKPFARALIDVAVHEFTA